ncbi:hypothetical protein BaRGS_00013972 [Batillaria attramentaria]|uniref:C-type lectin domain-containing protein n=1 Tax=Batillaria attramentaria TaxID=370345 RepID=A0ABD0L6S1_9CAEN
MWNQADDLFELRPRDLVSGGRYWGLPRRSAQCRSYHGHLVEINSPSENYKIVALAQERNVNYVWIGLNDLASGQDFRWDGSNSRPSYTNWRSGEPNNLGGDEDCVRLDADSAAKWNDADCHVRWPFCCERVNVVVSAVHDVVSVVNVVVNVVNVTVGVVNVVVSAVHVVVSVVNVVVRVVNAVTVGVVNVVVSAVHDVVSVVNVVVSVVNVTVGVVNVVVFEMTLDGVMKG